MIYFFDKTLDINSFVVVLPLVPVIARTGILKVFRCMFASSCNVCSTSSTRIVALPANAGSSITAATAPVSRAFAANLFPSKFSPLNAKNISPVFTSLESVVRRFELARINLYSSLVSIYHKKPHYSKP